MDHSSSFTRQRRRAARALQLGMQAVLLAAMLFGGSGCTIADWFPAEVGVLLPLTGDLAQAGADAMAAAELAQEDAESQGIFPRIRIRTADTNSDPRTALYALMEMANSKRLRIVAGPMSSSCVDNARLYADRNDIVLLSPSSTSPGLAIAGDSVYRMVPDDTKEAAALAEYIRNAGIEALVIVYRNDAYGLAMADTIHTQLREGVAARFPYAVTTTDFTALAASIAAALANAALSHDAAHTGLLLLSFDEAVELTDALRESPQTSAYPWFCSSSLTRNTLLLDSAERAAFLAEAGLAGPLLSLEAVSGNAEYQRVAQALTERLGHAPQIYAFYMYDAVRLAIETCRQTWPRLFRDFQSEFEGIAQGYTGITGTLTLNTAGDRDEGLYEFWQVQSAGWALQGEAR